MKKLLFLGGAVLLGLVVLVAGSKLYTGSQRDAIYEAVVRDMANPATNLALPKGAHVFFVRMEKQDPSPAFLARFNGSPFSVRKSSQCNLSPGSFSGHTTYDLQTKEPGVEIKLSHIQWMGLSKAIAWAGGMGYTVEKEPAGWQVKERLMMMAG